VDIFIANPPNPYKHSLYQKEFPRTLGGTGGNPYNVGWVISKGNRANFGYGGSVFGFGICFKGLISLLQSVFGVLGVCSFLHLSYGFCICFGG